MDSQTLEEWVRKLDQTFRMEERKIELLIKNCLSHPSVSNLTNLQLVFFLPNTTSVLQPHDQAVIRSPKADYRGRVVRRLCIALDKTKTLPKISILEAMKILVYSWGAMSAQTIFNYFRKTGFTPQAQNSAIKDAVDPIFKPKESLMQLHGIDPDMVPEGVTPESLIDVDNEVITTAPIITDDDILRNVTTNQSDEDDDNVEEVEEAKPEQPLISNVYPLFLLIHNEGYSVK